MLSPRTVLRLARRSVRRIHKVSANHIPLTPISFLERSEHVYADSTAVVHGDLQFTYAELGERCRRLSSALQKRGVQRGDTVSVIMTNTPEMLECHYGVPMAGAVLNTINTRLDPRSIAYILDHAETKVLLVDSEFASVVQEAIKIFNENQPYKHVPLIIDVIDSQFSTLTPTEPLTNDDLTYEDFLKEGDPHSPFIWPDDEWDTISLNYTSGTTGDPKGVLYHHRGAFLNSVSNAIVWNTPAGFRYLWTLPMFHCNGWCFPWTVTAYGGTHVCLRKVSAKGIYDSFADHKVTHLCGAPIIMQTLLDAPEDQRREFEQTVHMMTAAAPPPAVILQRMAEMGVEVLHVYGLTEVYGPVTVCVKKDEWKARPLDEQAVLNARQGVRYPMLEGLMVANPETLEATPKDGTTVGEIMMRGNVVMKGYFKNEKETSKAFAGGWFRTGDLAVRYPDNYVKIMDRSKDIIISGGENVSSQEVESILFKHGRVSNAAVVAKPDEKWGEVPCAFIEVSGAVSLTSDEEKELKEDIIKHCRSYLSGFKCPKEIVFGELPKTNVGKIQKFKLRDIAQNL